MDELELVGLADDGEHLVLSRADGERFRVRIDEPLRAAVRRDRPQLEQLRAEGAGTLSPREIQARIRAGATTQEVAEQSGLPVAHVRRYEGPVLAEREYVAEQARASRVGRDHGAPVLGDLVTDRLAARGVDLSSLAWDAAREANGPWFVLARFTVDDSPREARWSFDPVARTLVADEDEARWLSETELPDEPVSRRHLAAVRDVVFDIESVNGARPYTAGDPADGDTHEQPAVDPHEQTHALLDDLQARRGVRQTVEPDDDDTEFEGFGPQHAFDFSRIDDVPGAHPADADPQAEAVVLPAHRLTGRQTPPADDTVVEEPVETPAEPAPVEADDEPAKAPAAAAPDERPRGRKTRAKVPSWDEIVFGARPE